ncbi:MAG: hypothetical protein AAF449_17285, partial [Myxococcota bacterium]
PALRSRILRIAARASYTSRPSRSRILAAEGPSDRFHRSFRAEDIALTSVLFDFALPPLAFASAESDVGNDAAESGGELAHATALSAKNIRKWQLRMEHLWAGGERMVKIER